MEKEKEGVVRLVAVMRISKVHSNLMSNIHVFLASFAGCPY